MVKIRRAYEVLFLGLFFFFLIITDLRYLKGWPVSIFLEATPLVAVATALTTHTIYRNLVWGLVVIAITMMLGRVWCNWMCPFGILHHFFGWIGNRRNTKQMIEVNRYRKIYAIKYYILAAMLIMASMWIVSALLLAPSRIGEAYQELALKAGTPVEAMPSLGSYLAPGWMLMKLAALLGVALVVVRFLGLQVPDRVGKVRDVHALGGLATVAAVLLGLGIVRAGVPQTLAATRIGFDMAAEEVKSKDNSTLQIGLLDPIALTVRSMTTSVLPTVHKASENVYTEDREYMWGWIVGVMFVGLLVANWWIPRFFCRVLCPLGALLGFMCSFDLGGPVNKAAYAFCLGAMANGVYGPYAIFGAVKMVSAFTVTFSTMLAPRLFQTFEIETGKSTWLLGLAGITEGAIPMAIEDPIRVIGSFLAGSVVTGAMVGAMGIGLSTPGAGIFSLFLLHDGGHGALTAAAVWLGAALVGTLISTVVLIGWRRHAMQRGTYQVVAAE